MKKLELLAPARDVDGGKMAVDYGADALYVGGAAFGARRAAANSVDDIARLVDYARPFGVRVYAALNTLLFDHELEAAERVARQLIAAGVDALIVQDMAFLRMGLKGVEFHASTQMCNVDPCEIAFLGHAGFTRAILERGLDLDEIRTIRRASDIELECFVHGAICVGFSGRCFLSRSMSARSGNRGDCMQACRLPYDLLADGQTIIKGKHLLSPLDLDLSERLGELMDAGVTSFKIEGRLKDDNYVKNVVAHYRRALDKLGPRTSSGRSDIDFVPDPRRSFTRGQTRWALSPADEKRANFETPKATGAWVGDVVSVARDSFILSGNQQLAPGDGICFANSGTNVNAVDGRRVTPNKMDGVAAGISVFRSFDKAFDDLLNASRTRRTIACNAVLGPEELTLADEDGFSVSVCVPPAEAARDPEKAAASIRAQLAKTGGTIFRIDNVDIVGAAPFMPAGTLNALRRAATDALFKVRYEAPSQRRSAVEEPDFLFPGTPHNVVNRLARRFYADHGACEFLPPRELLNDFSGATVMTSSYCLRRETGMCGDTRELALRHGTHSYTLRFDCKKCRMSLVKV